MVLWGLVQHNKNYIKEPICTKYDLYKKVEILITQKLIAF